MRSISDSIGRLARYRVPMAGTGADLRPDRLADLEEFGTNPGDLGARTYIPTDLRDGAPLVVVLHGCSQTAVDADNDGGWSKLADRAGFALLFPEQGRTNNPNLC